tara:strand:+ start:11 stop:733 length:723 start_codon:yes stop_codon:yes gene_type:complete
MWLELIEKLFSDTEVIYINADLPLAIFMIKLLKSHINFDDFVHFQTFIDYFESSKSIELRYFIQYTIRVVIDQECIIKEKEIEDEIKKLDEMFQTISEEERKEKKYPPGYGTPVGPIIKTPTYENRLILYDTFIKGKNLKQQYADYWIQKEVSLERSKEPVCRTSWMLENYYNYFNTELNNKYYLYNRVGNNMSKTNIYRQLEKDILQILNKFNTEEDFNKLLKSIRDVKLMENQESLMP